MNKLDTIGKRAAWAFDKRCVETRSRKGKECAKLNVTPATVSNWRTGDTEPRGYHLQQMARNGYDVMWILLGDEYDRG